VALNDMHAYSSSDRIRSHLETLCESQRSAALIIEESGTGKFIQFIWMPEDGLYVDLPADTLDAMELTRAKTILATYGIPFSSWPLYEGPGGAVSGTQSGFNQSIGRECDLAFQIAMTTFSDIYAAPENAKLELEVVDLEP
jgi:hypothetical protein